MRFTLLFLSLLLFVGSAAAQDSAAEHASPTGIVVSETGGEPRQTLRYNLEAVTAQTTQMDMNLNLNLGMAGQTFDQAMPTIRTSVSVVEPFVNGDGNLRIGFRMDGMVMVDNGTPVDPMMREQLDAAFSQMDGFSRIMVIDDCGNLVSSDFDLESVAPALRQQLESAIHAMQQSVIPLPEEPVGVGAHWTVDMPLSINGMSLAQTTSYEVTEFGEGYVVISSTITQSAVQQLITLSDMPGASVELMSYTGSGTGLATVRLDRVMADGTMSLNSNCVMRTGVDVGMPMDLNLQMAIEVEMTTQN
jgi:hypothetical protein